jgi:hypothetical protein
VSVLCYGGLVSAVCYGGLVSALCYGGFFVCCFCLLFLLFGLFTDSPVFVSDEVIFPYFSFVLLCV